MKSSVKVSIVAPVYNADRFIHKCLDSLIRQTLPEIEIILINDCSTDNSGQICEEYAGKDSRVKVIHNEENIKQGLSRNKGIDLAQGEYIAFIDPDDWVDLDFYEKLYLAAIKANADIAKTERKLIYESGELVDQTKLNDQIRQALQKGLTLLSLFTYEHTTAIFRTSVLQNNNVRYSGIRNAEDNTFLLQATHYCKGIVLITGTYYYYLQHPASAKHQKDKTHIESKITALCESLKYLNSFDISEEHYNDVFKSIVLKTLRYIQKNHDFEMDYLRSQYQSAFTAMLDYKYLDFSLLNQRLPDVFHSSLFGNKHFVANAKLGRILINRIRAVLSKISRRLFGS